MHHVENDVIFAFKRRIRELVYKAPGRIHFRLLTTVLSLWWTEL